MICSNCKFYTVLIEDDDTCGTPWCLLADDALPDDIFRPFDCICPDLKERKERIEEIEEDLAEIAEDPPPINTGLLAGLYGFEAIMPKEDK